MEKNKDEVTSIGQFMYYSNIISYSYREEKSEKYKNKWHRYYGMKYESLVELIDHQKSFHLLVFEENFLSNIENVEMLR